MTSQLNVRIPESTQEQIEKLVADTGMTQTQIVILAIDRFYQARERDKFMSKQLHGKKVKEMLPIIEQAKKEQGNE